MTTWIKHYRNGFGSAARVQRNAYAYAVAMVMTDGRSVCPCCDAPVDYFQSGSVEVDRVHGDERDAEGSAIYREGSIVYVCRDCNQSRAALQSRGEDWTHVDQYVQDVADASAMVTVPTVREAREWWSSRGTGGTVSRYA